MAKSINIAGQKFGRLTAIRDVGKKGSFRLWDFVCDCGSVVQKTAATVRFGSVLSCGCLQSEKISARTTKDITGMRFERLSVQERSGVDHHGKVLWRCLCDCGAVVVVSGGSLRKGTTRSCGCLRRQLAADRQRAKKLPLEIKSESKRASAAKQRAIRKNSPLAVMQSRLSRLHRHALAQVGAIKKSPTFEQLGYTVSDFVAHIERQFMSGMNWSNMKEWQIDHITPISNAKTFEDVVALNQLSNLRPMWARENNAKKNKRTHLL